MRILRYQLSMQPSALKPVAKELSETLRFYIQDFYWTLLQSDRFTSLKLQERKGQRFVVISHPFPDSVLLNTETLRNDSIEQMFLQ